MPVARVLEPWVPSASLSPDNKLRFVVLLILTILLSRLIYSSISLEVSDLRAAEAGSTGSRAVASSV